MWTLTPVCKACGVVCEYSAAMGDWGLSCPKCGAWRAGPEGLQPSKDQLAYRRSQRDDHGMNPAPGSA